MLARHVVTMAATLLLDTSVVAPLQADAKVIRHAAADNLLEVRLRPAV
jgi:hypothetical protein